MRHVKRPCDECPWRKDSEPGRFDAERWEGLACSSADERNFGPEFGGSLFGCHKTPEGAERACAGWLAVEGLNHPVVRLAIILGDLPIEATQPKDDWPELHPSFVATRAHDEML